LEKSFYILNPHRDDFIWEPLYFNYIKRRPLKKYNYIAEIFAENKNVKLLISDNCSGLLPQKIINLLPTFLRKAFINFELKKWKKINGIEAEFSHAYIDDKMVIAPNDEVFLFQLSNEKYIASLLPILEKFKNTFVHLSHFYLDPKRISATFSKLQNVMFCGDSDISNHSFFKKYFPWYNNKFILSPFYIADRFTIIKPWADRQHKIMSAGTFHDIEEYPNSMYLKTEIGVDAFHYNRKNIFEAKENLQQIVTCHNSAWKQNDAPWYKKWWNAQKVSQKEYFKMDIVAEYNNHQYALIGEEICGFPGIGTFEAMACGCAVLANKDSLVGVIDDATLYIDFSDIGKLDTIVKAGLIIDSVASAHFINNHFRKTHCLVRFKKTFGV
jgi:hypothetical protein